MEKLPRQFQRLSILLFTITVFVSGNNLANEKREPISERKVVKRASERKNCYDGNGSSYRGYAAVTESGFYCRRWSLSSEVNERTHPGKGLRSNYCRNPDGSNKPWCWTNHTTRRSERCIVSKCSEVATISDNSYVLSILFCKAKQFYCPRQKVCISKFFRCDNELNCDYGEDEEGCFYSLNSFKKIPNSSLSLYNDRLSYESQEYKNITDELCAKKCAKNTQFKCKSFMYEPVEKTCYLSRWNSDYGVGRIILSRIFDYYELKQENSSLNNFKKMRGAFLKLYNNRKSYASEKYKHISNELCAKKCAEHTEFKCKSFTYKRFERTCYLSKFNFHSGVGVFLPSRKYDYYELKQETTYKVKLVDGRNPSQGNLEVVINKVKYSVCDDNWDNKDATVICRILGYSGGVATENSKFGSRSNIDIALTEVNCHGTETEFNQCQAVVGRDKNDCGSNELAGAICNMAPV